MMRYVTAATCLAVLTFFVGCSFFGVRDEQARVRDSGAAQSESQVLQTLNQNSARINALDCTHLEIDCKQGSQQVTPVGWMTCQKPRSFCLKAKAVGKDAVFMGSNSDEFWYWMKDQPYLAHCSWEALQRGNVQGMQFPFQPEWLMEVLGMGTYDEDIKKYTVSTKDGMYVYEQAAQSPTGDPMKKVMIVDRTKYYGVPTVKEFQLRDKDNKVLCSAVVTKPQYDKEYRAVFPFEVVVKMPNEQGDVTLKFTLRDAKVVREIDRSRAEGMFSRKNLQWATFDLASGRPDNGNSDSKVNGVIFHPPQPIPPPSR